MLGRQERKNMRFRGQVRDSREGVREGQVTDEQKLKESEGARPYEYPREEHSQPSAFAGFTLSDLTSS